MRCRTTIPAMLLPLMALGTCAALSDATPQSPAPAAGAGLTSEQVRALVARAIANQQRNHAALEEYERTERVVDHGKGEKAEETTELVVPRGTGDFRIPLARNGKPAERAELDKQWNELLKALEAAAIGRDPEHKRRLERFTKRREERVEMVDAIGEAFRFRYVGRAYRDGRPLIELAFEPEPEFRSSKRYASIFSRTRGRVWIDEASGHVARVTAELYEDVPFLGGLIGKIYQGSWLSIEQAETAPDVWLPTRYSYLIDARKVFFPVRYHTEVEASGYRRVGPPEEALPVLRRQREGMLAAAAAP